MGKRERQIVRARGLRDTAYGRYIIELTTTCMRHRSHGGVAEAPLAMHLGCFVHQSRVRFSFLSDGRKLNTNAHCRVTCYTCQAKKKIE